MHTGSAFTGSKSTRTALPGLPRDTGDQLAEFGFDGRCQLEGGINARAAFAAFQQANLGAVQRGADSGLFLGQARSAVPGRIDAVINRAQIAANVAGSLRLEGLEPTGPVRELADLWVRGDATDADLREAERRLLAGEPLEGLITAAATNGASRHV